MSEATSDDVSVRVATAGDAAAAVSLLRESISQLCVLDHQNDPETLDRWLANKTVERVTAWLTSNERRVFVAERAALMAGVALLHREGEIRLCYVLPGLERMGVGRSLLRALELQASAWGLRKLSLTSTLGARPFYEREGFVEAGPAIALFGVLRGYPYEKVLAYTVD